MTFIEKTKKFLKEYRIKVGEIKCAFVHVVESFKFNDLPYAPDKEWDVVLKEQFTVEELETFLKDLEFKSAEGDTVVTYAYIWLNGENFGCEGFCNYDAIKNEWKYITIPIIRNECKRG